MIPNLIVPVLNRYDLLQRMLDSIDYPVRELLIIDNGDGPEESLIIPDRVRNFTYLPMPSNLGVAGSWNLGIKSFPHNNRWFFASNDMVFGEGALEQLGTALPSNLTLVQPEPHWQTFVLGEAIVDKVGLFDEAYYPAYFEDNDYMRRMEAEKLKPVYLNVPITHDNSSTIKSDENYQKANYRSFENNRNRFVLKNMSKDYSCHGWTLSVRRKNSWD